MSDALKELLVIREDIYTHFQESRGCDDFFIVDEANQDKYAAYYTSMYLLQDTTESLIHHRVTGFSTNCFKGYIEFWGVMQALIIQQDALKALFAAIHEDDDWPLEPEPWKEIRSLRNLCAGHPAHQARKGEKAKRTFMGREFGTYDAVTFELWDEATKKISHVTFDLSALIDRYAEEAKYRLEDILKEMKRRWP
jgi:hypothetical protein